MKLLLIIAILVHIALASTVTVRPPHQLTAQDLIRAVNKVRINPSSYADFLVELHISKGVNGTKNDPQVFVDLEKELRSMAPLPPLVEDLAIDLSAWRHANWMATKKIFSHRGPNGTMEQSRIMEVGDFIGSKLTSGSIAFAGGRPTPELFVGMWLDDLNQLARLHRKFVLSQSRPRIGCGYSAGYVSCVTSFEVKLHKNITKDDLAQAGLSKAVNGVGFTGV